jgi:hypothetical protein
MLPAHYLAGLFLASTGHLSGCALFGVALRLVLITGALSIRRVCDGREPELGGVRRTVARMGDLRVDGRADRRGRADRAHLVRRLPPAARRPRAHALDHEEGDVAHARDVPRPDGVCRRAAPGGERSLGCAGCNYKLGDPVNFAGGARYQFRALALLVDAIET